MRWGVGGDGVDVLGGFRVGEFVVGKFSCCFFGV